MKLRVAATQFTVGAEPLRNAARIVDLVGRARRARARVALFPETALSGYAGVEHQSLAGFDWGALEEATTRVAAAAREHGVWVVCGTLHRPTGRGARGKPLNSVLVIDPAGETVARYDKRLLAAGEQRHYRPGARPVVAEIEGLRCGLLICHEWRYPELYRQYRELGAEVILQSWYDGAYTDAAWRREGRLLSEVVPATVQGHAVCHHLWICGSNTTRRRSAFGGFVLRPDGRFLARLPRHRPGLSVATVDTGAAIPDPSAHNRRRVARGLPAEA